MSEPRTDYVAIAASQTTAAVGNGKKGDIIQQLIIIPATTSPGAVKIRDGASGSDITVFTGGATSVADLKPIVLDLGMRSNQTGGFEITTGASVSVLAVGRFQ